MSTGHDEDTFPAMRQSADWVRTFLAQPLVHAPGTHFLYNTGATYMLSALAQRISGQRLLDYLTPRLFDPLGIQGPTWDQSPQGIDIGGTGLHMTTADIARFGQLYLQQGVWQGQQVLEPSWIAEATARQIANGTDPQSDWAQGYGYQFWRCRHGAYRGDGAFGQFCMVLPAQDAVVAITAGTDNMQGVLDLVWQHLLPAMGRTPLGADRPAQEALMARLAGLRMPPPRGQQPGDAAARLSGQSFALASNADDLAAISFRFGAEDDELTLHSDRGEQRIVCGHQEWKRGIAALEQSAGAGPTPVAASGVWQDERTYVAQLWWYETPFGRTLTCRFDGDRVAITQRVNVGFGPTERPSLQGQVAQPGLLPPAGNA